MGKPFPILTPSFTLISLKALLSNPLTGAKVGFLHQCRLGVSWLVQTGKGLAFIDDKGKTNIKQFRFMKVNLKGSIDIEIGDDDINIGTVSALSGHCPYVLKPVGQGEGGLRGATESNILKPLSSAVCPNGVPSLVRS